MTDPDAYDHEMERIWRLSDEDIDRVFAGESARDEDFDGLQALLRDVRDDLGRPVAAAKRDQDLAILALEASHLRDGVVEPSDVRTPRSWREILHRTRSIALKGAATVAAASLSMFGLAYAGVDLPGQASEKAQEKQSGSELSNQGGGGEVEVTQGGKSVADDVKAFIESTDLTGCEFGQGVAEIASQNAQGETGPAEDPCTKDDDSDDAEDAATTGQEMSAEARAKAAGAGKANGAEDDADDTEDADEESDDDTEDDEGSGGAGAESEKSDEGNGRKP